MAGAVRRRWPRRLAVVGAVTALAAAIRERKLRENARRYGLPS